MMLYVVRTFLFKRSDEVRSFSYSETTKIKNNRKERLNLPNKKS
tara:strand:+ start:3541 stop:3672 length:132 start_codon:yes stop_codon:yes gene_type:complete